MHNKADGDKIVLPEMKPCLFVSMFIAIKDELTFSQAEEEHCQFYWSNNAFTTGPVMVMRHQQQEGSVITGFRMVKCAGAYSARGSKLVAFRQDDPTYRPIKMKKIGKRFWQIRP